MENDEKIENYSKLLKSRIIEIASDSGSDKQKLDNETYSSKNFIDSTRFRKSATNEITAFDSAINKDQ